MNRKLILSLMGIMLIIGCLGPSQKSLSGIYHSKYSKHSLELNEDGTYNEYDGALVFKFESGTYEVKGNEITFIGSGGFAVKGKIKGDEIIIEEETALGLYKEHWVKISKN